MEILRIILTVIFVLDCIGLTVIVLMQEGKQQGLGSIAGVADTYWGRNKRTFYGGWSGKGDYCHGNPVFCSGCHFEYEFLRIMEGKMETLL